MLGPEGIVLQAESILLGPKCLDCATSRGLVSKIIVPTKTKIILQGGALMVCRLRAPAGPRPHGRQATFWNACKKNVFPYQCLQGCAPIFSSPAHPRGSGPMAVGPFVESVQKHLLFSYQLLQRCAPSCFQAPLSRGAPGPWPSGHFWNARKKSNYFHISFCRKGRANFFRLHVRARGPGPRDPGPRTPNPGPLTPGLAPRHRLRAPGPGSRP